MRVVVRFRFEGLHSWPTAPDGPVSFLRHVHRHEFHVEAAKDVSHDDRDIEIIQLKNAMQAHAAAEFAGPHSLSCEMMARALLLRYGLARCMVLEDGENGAEVLA